MVSPENTTTIIFDNSLQADHFRRAPDVVELKETQPGKGDSPEQETFLRIQQAQMRKAILGLTPDQQGESGFHQNGPEGQPVGESGAGNENGNDTPGEPNPDRSQNGNDGKGSGDESNGGSNQDNSQDGNGSGSGNNDGGGSGSGSDGGSGNGEGGGNQ